MFNKLKQMFSSVPKEEKKVVVKNPMDDAPEIVQQYHRIQERIYSAIKEEHLMKLIGFNFNAQINHNLHELPVNIEGLIKNLEVLTEDYELTKSDNFWSKVKEVFSTFSLAKNKEQVIAYYDEQKKLDTSNKLVEERFFFYSSDVDLEKFENKEVKEVSVEERFERINQLYLSQIKRAIAQNNLWPISFLLPNILAQEEVGEHNYYLAKTIEKLMQTEGFEVNDQFWVTLNKLLLICTDLEKEKEYKELQEYIDEEKDLKTLEILK
ncbi:hypothetical protein [Flammeovirga kamogawensis]|uniref:Uncharacterized protein n=1 Tax=Flammeovirga kamogawensis TaxID=373891 RepID=A0ABX8H1E4_9BACT|nr:hypothetical protein [Flammeovirga kamogawensis]MBB6463774.1 hypothetical protein [Flammeovirga kamogawensis]QWG09714.1 hypothetical protein KM029_24255 [Flammeovirga kamogawensis]TRX65227.1 hypothetical protein EO216_22145 [Flammeovirga kamogawensis]